MNATPAGFTGVQTYPDVRQLFNNWTGKGWRRTAKANDTPIASLSSLRSSFSESMPHNSTTSAQAAYDIWLGRTPRTDAHEVMVWVDNSQRNTDGAEPIGYAHVARQSFRVVQYHGHTGEIIFVLTHNEHSGTVHILDMVRWLVRHRYEPASMRVAQIDFGWEICSETSGAQDDRFTVSRYSITATPRKG